MRKRAQQHAIMTRSIELDAEGSDEAFEWRKGSEYVHMFADVPFVRNDELLFEISELEVDHLF